MKEAVLKIYYTDKYGELHYEAQGKFFYSNGKPIFLADMTDHKWWRNYSGYSIAKQILQAFSKVKVRPDIIYRLKTKGILYYTKATMFIKMGIAVPYGSHEQYVLPIKNWKVTQGTIPNEPHNLPEMTLSHWVKTNDADYKNNTSQPVSFGLISDEARLKIRQNLVAKGVIKA